MTWKTIAASLLAGVLIAPVAQAQKLSPELKALDEQLPGTLINDPTRLDWARQEFEDYLKCGLPELGFLRVKCDGCRHEHLVAFSCKRRGFCPSCGPRRMVESAAHLVDHVFPEVAVRQRRLSRHGGLRACS